MYASALAYVDASSGGALTYGAAIRGDTCLCTASRQPPGESMYGVSHTCLRIAADVAGMTPINADTSGTYINGTVRSGGIAVEGVTVSTNTSITTTTDASGFYSLTVTAGTSQLTAAKEPVYYTNSSVTATVDSGVVVRDIELVEKPTGTISGSVTNAQGYEESTTEDTEITES